MVISASYFTLLGVFIRSIKNCQSPLFSLNQRLKQSIKQASFVLVCCFFQIGLSAKTISIEYEFPGAKEVSLFWGINDWHTIQPLPANTKITNQIMETPMLFKQGKFYCTVQIPDDAYLNLAISFQNKLSPIGPTLFYLDNNAEKNYLYKASETNKIIISAKPNNLVPHNNIKPFQYASALLMTIGMIALIAFLVQYKKSRKPFGAISSTDQFFILSFSFLLSLMFIRIQTTQFLYAFLANPFMQYAKLSNAFIPDLVYAFCVTCFFGLGYWIFNNQRKLWLYLFATIAFISIIAAIINISVIEVLGKPFNYPWLYYSDFLSSTDAKLAMGANINSLFIASIFFFIITALLLTYLVHIAWKQKRVVVFLICSLFILPGFFVEANNTLPTEKRVNPVSYFIASTNIFDWSNNKVNANTAELAIKNIDTTATIFSASFKKNSIKNVLMIVLESTPAEYVSAFDTSVNATPFLKSMQKNSILFNSIYAHVPATNKSLVSLLTASYPYISFKSITVEKPSIALTSISDLLKKQGFATEFFNAGDLRFQNAQGFLEQHHFDVLQDFRSTQINTTVLTDDRFAKENGNGMADLHLYDQFTNWHSKNKSTPFFGMLWTFQTHYPYYDLGLRKNYGTGNPNKERYLNALSQADALIKKLYDYLQVNNLSDSTLIVVMGDHGEAFGTHQQITHANGIYEENLHVPMMFINKNLFNGQVMNTVGGLSDIAPSILAILNQQAPKNWQGENLFSLNRRKKVFFFSPYSDYLLGFRENNYKFIFNTSTNTALLFDLSKDPKELNNIASQHPSYVDSAKQSVKAWVAYQSNFMNQLLK